MRKFLLFLLLLPSIIVLGHDVYMFSQNPDKGFMLSDIGALWAKYHKESHDKWKINLNKLGKAVNDLNLIDKPTTSNQIKTKDINSYNDSFTQTITRDGQTSISPLKEENLIQTNTSKIQQIIGFILEQKALFIFAGIAGFILLIYGIIKLLFREKSEESNIRGIKKKKGKDGEYTYGRK